MLWETWTQGNYLDDLPIHNEGSIDDDYTGSLDERGLKS
jgi:hypothetical protein